ncbi:hypothetical protein TWF217_011501 [Orbilia oligospora]|nr:hypothetical protein TWF217_011501 [Orbilia oligospora]
MRIIMMLFWLCWFLWFLDLVAKFVHASPSVGYSTVKTIGSPEQTHSSFWSPFIVVGKDGKTTAYATSLTSNFHILVVEVTQYRIANGTIRKLPNATKHSRRERAFILPEPQSLIDIEALPSIGGIAEMGIKALAIMPEKSIDFYHPKLDKHLEMPVGPYSLKSYEGRLNLGQLWSAYSMELQGISSSMEMLVQPSQQEGSATPVYIYALIESDGSVTPLPRYPWTKYSKIIQEMSPMRLLRGALQTSKPEPISSIDLLKLPQPSDGETFDISIFEIHLDDTKKGFLVRQESIMLLFQITISIISLLASQALPSFYRRTGETFTRVAYFLSTILGFIYGTRVLTETWSTLSNIQEIITFLGRTENRQHGWAPTQQMVTYIFTVYNHDSVKLGNIYFMEATVLTVASMMLKQGFASVGKSTRNTIWILCLLVLGVCELVCFLGVQRWQFLIRFAMVWAYWVHRPVCKGLYLVSGVVEFLFSGSSA